MIYYSAEIRRERERERERRLTRAQNRSRIKENGKVKIKINEIRLKPITYVIHFILYRAERGWK